MTRHKPVLTPKWSAPSERQPRRTHLPVTLAIVAVLLLCIAIVAFALRYRATRAAHEPQPAPWVGKKK